MAYVVSSFTWDRAKEFARAVPPLGAGFPDRSVPHRQGDLGRFLILRSRSRLEPVHRL